MDIETTRGFAQLVGSMLKLTQLACARPVRRLFRFALEPRLGGGEWWLSLLLGEEMLRKSSLWGGN